MLNIAGAGMTCPVPQNLYPSELNGVAPDAPTNYVDLAAGDAIQIPAQSNQYLIDLGAYSTLEFLDAVSGTWRVMPDGAPRQGPFHIQSDGVTKRVANRLGCPVAAVVTGAGSGFAQSTATITSSVGGSTWVAVVGGSLSVSTINNAGANYTVPPIVMIPIPGTAGVNGFQGGVPATARATIANGTVSAVSLTNVGAGYLSAPTAVLIPSPFDVNAGSITNATITLVLNAANAGKITAALCTNHGAPLATISALTLTASGGGGTGATIVPQVLQTVVSNSIVAGGAGWGTASLFAQISTAQGGNANTSAIGNPVIELTSFRPRPAQGVATTNAGGTITTVTMMDNGLFISAPNAVLATPGTLATTLASISLTTGSTYDTVLLQPL